MKMPITSSPTRLAMYPIHYLFEMPAEALHGAWNGWVRRMQKKSLIQQEQKLSFNENFFLQFFILNWNSFLICIKLLLTNGCT